MQLTCASVPAAAMGVYELRKVLGCLGGRLAMLAITSSVTFSGVRRGLSSARGWSR